ncbi:hypothetical protein [Nonomuraea sp. NPDC005650]|uniref:hypothetical protein n=1 Tax=Nonomuraea sp. NPDC005650 TaxID=3157045 RepID=UPI0033B87898
MDARLSKCFRRAAFSVKALGTQSTYAPLYRLFFSFLLQRGLLYDIAAKRGYVPASPVTLPAPSDVKTSDVKWLSPWAFRLWRNVGLNRTRLRLALYPSPIEGRPGTRNSSVHPAHGSPVEARSAVVTLLWLSSGFVRVASPGAVGDYRRDVTGLRKDRV